MSYHQFSNICEIIGGSVDTKLKIEIFLLDFVDQNCNFNRASKVKEENFPTVKNAGTSV